MTATIGPRPVPADRSLAYTMRIATLEWIAGVYLLIVGMARLILTHNIPEPVFGPLWLRGIVSVAGGLALLWLSCINISATARSVVLVFVAVSQALFGLAFLSAGVYSTAATLLLLALAVLVAAFVRRARPEDGLRPILAGLMLGAMEAVQGVDLLVRGQAAGAVPPRLNVAPEAVGAAFLAAGLLVVVVQLLEGSSVRVPRGVVKAVHVTAGVLLIGLWLAQSLLLGQNAWMYVLGALPRGAALALLPWLSDWVIRLDTHSIRPRFTLAFVMAALTPLLVALILVVQADVDSASRFSHEAGFAVMLLASALAVVLGVWLSGRLTEPLTALVERVDRIAGGERPPQPVQDYALTEIVRVNNAVDAMMRALDERAAEESRLQQAHAANMERQRLAQELHDSVMQTMFGITMTTHNALQHWVGKPELARSRVEQAQSLARRAQAEMRALVFDLRPNQLAENGLVKALELQTEALAERHEFEVAVDLGEEPDLPLEVKEAFYRIGQEALNNAVKHARAARVSLTLANGAGRVTLTIADSGRGFDPQGSFPGQVGLRSMQDRAAAVGARLCVESSEKGTAVSVSYPR